MVFEHNGKTTQLPEPPENNFKRNELWGYLLLLLKLYFL
jgi:hypothetical protein